MMSAKTGAGVEETFHRLGTFVARSQFGLLSEEGEEPRRDGPPPLRIHLLRNRTNARGPETSNT